jgi:hypothetical protein
LMLTAPSCSWCRASVFALTPRMDRLVPSTPLVDQPAVVGREQSAAGEHESRLRRVGRSAAARQQRRRGRPGHRPGRCTAARGEPAPPHRPGGLGRRRVGAATPRARLWPGAAIGARCSLVGAGHGQCADILALGPWPVVRHRTTSVASARRGRHDAGRSTCVAPRRTACSPWLYLKVGCVEPTHAPPRPIRPRPQRATIGDRPADPRPGRGS